MSSKVKADYDAPRVFLRKHNYGSGVAAANVWCDGPLWGCPIILSENNVHVYGLSRRTWRGLMVQFTKDAVIIIPNQDIREYIEGARDSRRQAMRAVGVNQTSEPS